MHTIFTLRLGRSQVLQLLTVVRELNSGPVCDKEPLTEVRSRPDGRSESALGTLCGEPGSVAPEKSLRFMVALPVRLAVDDTHCGYPGSPWRQVRGPMCALGVGVTPDGSSDSTLSNRIRWDLGHGLSGLRGFRGGGTLGCWVRPLLATQGGALRSPSWLRSVSGLAP